MPQSSILKEDSINGSDQLQSQAPQSSTTEEFRHLSQKEINEVFPHIKEFRDSWITGKPKKIYIGKERTPLQVYKEVGRGGSKFAWQYSEDEVILLPNTNIPNWQRMVDEEVFVSEKLTELGILNVHSKKVNVYFEGAKLPMIVYVCPSFKSLIQKGMFVIDIRGRPDLSPIAQEPIFKEGQDPTSAEAWLPLVTPLAKDLVTVAKHNCLFGLDSWNGVLVKGKNGAYELRYFGFDFSSKSRPFDRDFTQLNDKVNVEEAFTNILYGLMQSLQIPNRSALIKEIIFLAKQQGVAFS